MENVKFELSIFLLTWLWTKFDPLQELIEIAFEKLEKKTGENIVNKAVYSVLSCWYCLALWSSLIFLGWGEWFTAIAISFLAWFFEMITKQKK